MDIEIARASQLANIAIERPLQNPALSDNESEQTNATDETSNSVNASQSNADTQSNEANQQPADLESAVSQVSDFVQAQSRNLNFSFDNEAQRSIVKVTDSDTGELIRQIPSEEVLRLSERIKNLQSDVDSTVGVLFNKEV